MAPDHIAETALLAVSQVQREAAPKPIFEAVMACEENDPLDVLDDWQRLIDAGIVWQLQGRFGRTAAGLINAGHCHAA